MATTLEHTLSSSSSSGPPLAVLPCRRRRDGALDAVSALDLAILGATACRLTPLNRLVDTVWCLTGGGWRPPWEVVLEALQQATRAGTVAATESWVRSIPFFYTLTPAGAAEFRRLMRMPLPAQDDPISRASAAVKFGLLDVTELCDAGPVAADLRRFYLDCRAGLEERREGLLADRPFLHQAVGDRIAWIDSRIAALDDLTSGFARRAGGGVRQS